MATDPRELRRQIERTRALIGSTMGLESREIVLTMGTTHGFQQLLLHKKLFCEGRPVVVSDLMYPKMYNALDARCDCVEVAPVSQQTTGEEIARCLASLVTPKTQAVVADVVDNRRGLVVALECLHDAVRQANPEALIVLDASQAYVQIPELCEAPRWCDVLIADLKKWCQNQSWAGLGFLATCRSDILECIASTANSQYALHPDWLAATCAGDDPLIGRADAGGADLVGWCQAHDSVLRAFRSLPQGNGQIARRFWSQLRDIPGPWRLWPEQSSPWMSGIVSLVGSLEELHRWHVHLHQQGIVCSLIPTNLEPLPCALGPHEACLRFSFHDGKTRKEELQWLERVLRTALKEFSSGARRVEAAVS